MKNLLKTGLLAIVIAISVSACGDQSKPATESKIDTAVKPIDTAKKDVVTTKVDTTKKDTAKKP